jgi:UDP-GlcNAc:undecaprenyl-phosphate GlcNAc-1-phosphate transferase
MSNFVVIAVVAAVACVGGVVVGPLACWAVRRCGLVDRPDGRRKLHGRTVPLAGGPLVLLVSLAVVVGWLIWDGRFGEVAQPERFSLPLLALATLVMFAVGLVDDIYGLRGRVKLAGQVVSVLIAVAAGVRIDEVHVLGVQFYLGPVAIPLTVFWLLGAVNAVNLLDGIDGMVGSMTVVIAGSLAVMAGCLGHVVPGVVAAALAGSVAAFLLFNKPPARMFLGDSGSLTLGLLLGCLAVVCSLKGPATVMFSLPVTLLFLPVLDTAAAITRRMLTGRSIFTTDRGHLQHRLLQSGMSHHGVLALVVGLNFVLGVGAIASLALQNDGLAVAAAGLVALTLLVSRLFGVQEVNLLRKQLESVLRLRRVAKMLGVGGEGVVGVQLQGTTTGWESVVGHVTARGEELVLDTIHIDVNAPQLQEAYFVHWSRTGQETAGGETWCQVNLPLRVGGQAVGRVKITARDHGHNRVEVVASVLTLVDELNVLAARALSGKAVAPRPVVERVLQTV